MSVRSFAELQGQLIAKARREAGKTQEEAAKAVEVSATTIGRWERGQAGPTMPELYMLARFFKIPLRQLVFLGRDDDRLDLSCLPLVFQAAIREHVKNLRKAILAGQ